MAKAQTLVPSLIYKDSEKAMTWLEQVFGFEIAMVVRDDKGKAIHIEMSHGEALLYVGNDDWSELIASPASLGGKTTAIMSLHVDDVDAHFARAKTGGARIVAEPEDQFYGDRVYRALDLEGHYWTFHHEARDISITEMERTSGHKIEIKK